MQAGGVRDSRWKVILVGIDGSGRRRPEKLIEGGLMAETRNGLPGPERIHQWISPRYEVSGQVRIVEWCWISFTRSKNCIARSSFALTLQQECR
jgi:hypothetical protein